MKYCPECGAEFFDDIKRCSECELDLVSEQDWAKIRADRSMENQEYFRKVKTVENQFEADILKDALDKEGIPVLVRSFQDTSFNGIFIPQKGWGIILVPDEYLEKTKEVINALESKQQ
jgi:hypothetical protein